MTDEILKTTVTQVETSERCASCGEVACRLYREFYEEYVAGQHREVDVRKAYLCRIHSVKVLRSLPPKDDASRMRAADRLVY